MAPGRATGTIRPADSPVPGDGGGDQGPVDVPLATRVLGARNPEKPCPGSLGVCGRGRMGITVGALVAVFVAVLVPLFVALVISRRK